MKRQAYIWSICFLLCTTVVHAKNKFRWTKKGSVIVTAGSYKGKTYGLTEANFNFHPLPSPGRTYACKRVDYMTKPKFRNSGGEVFTKSSCKRGQTTAKVRFKIHTRYIRAAESYCRINYPKGKRIMHTSFPALLRVRYCFLNMKPKITRKGRSVRKRWYVDCKRDGIFRWHTVHVPYTIKCRKKLRVLRHSDTH